MTEIMHVLRLLAYEAQVESAGAATRMFWYQSYLARAKSSSRVLRAWHIQNSTQSFLDSDTYVRVTVANESQSGNPCPENSQILR